MGRDGQHGALAPDQAREISQRWAAEFAVGGDSAGDKLKKRKSPTVGEPLGQYLEAHAGVKNTPGTARNAALLVNKLIRRALGQLKVADVTALELVRLHAAHAKTPNQAGRARSVLSKAFALAETWGYRERNSNPCTEVGKFREAALGRFSSPAEFAALGEVLAKAERCEALVIDKNGKPRSVKVRLWSVAAIRLLILTGARHSEILGLCWKWIDWTAGGRTCPTARAARNR